MIRQLAQQAAERAARQIAAAAGRGCRAVEDRVEVPAEAVREEYGDGERPSSPWAFRVLREFKP